MILYSSNMLKLLNSSFFALVPTLCLYFVMIMYVALTRLQGQACCTKLNPFPRGAGGEGRNCRNDPHRDLSEIRPVSRNNAKPHHGPKHMRKISPLLQHSTTKRDNKAWVAHTTPHKTPLKCLHLSTTTSSDSNSKKTYRRGALHLVPKQPRIWGSRTVPGTPGKRNTWNPGGKNPLRFPRTCSTSPHPTAVCNTLKAAAVWLLNRICC